MTETRERILECACDLYLQDGFEGFSMRKLARSVGVTAPALYRHFQGREKLLLEVLGEAYDELFRTLLGALAGSTPLERFELAGQAYMEFALAHPRYFQMIHAFAEFMGLEDLPEELVRRCGALEQFWDDRVRECVHAGVLKADDPDKISLTLWSHAYGLISLYQKRLLVRSEAQFREEYRASFHRILSGLGAESAQPAVTSMGETR
jgi:AcrR family transcriptional regulator